MKDLDMPPGAIPVLDRGFIALLDHMGDDTTIVNAARVSFGKRVEKMSERDERLIRYLLKNRHTSPFEHVQFQFHVKCPLFVRSQWHRHRTWSYNEISSRYTEVKEEFYVPTMFRRQSPSNKQASVEEPADEVCFNVYRNEKTGTEEAYIESCKLAVKQYRELLKAGVARELARAVLPQAMYTQFYATVDLHNLLHFVELRIHPHAQWEIQQYARAILKLIKPIVPVTVKIWSEIKGVEVK